MEKLAPKNKIIFSVGHSSLSLENFVQLINCYQIQTIIDMRRFPFSKKIPHFNKANLLETLSKKSIAYLWLGDLLGGFRADGYQQYTSTQFFKDGFNKLLVLCRNVWINKIVMVKI